MDMARAILERVAEVELQITPEFQKKKSGGSYALSGGSYALKSLEAALEKNGWQEDKGYLVAPDVKISTWTHPDLLGVTIGVTYDWKKNVLYSDTITVEKGGEAATTHPATPEMVDGLTDEWKAEAGAARGGATPVGSGEWPEPMRHSWNMSPRIDYEWENKATMSGVGMSSPAGGVYAISWPTSSASLANHWGAAIQAVKKLDEWVRVLVYNVDEKSVAEFDNLILKGVIDGVFYPGNVDDDPEYSAKVAALLGEHTGDESTVG